MFLTKEMYPKYTGKAEKNTESSFKMTPRIITITQALMYKHIKRQMYLLVYQWSVKSAKEMSFS